MMSCTTQRVLLTMLLYELLRRQRRREADDDEDEDDWTDETDSEEDDDDDDEYDETSSSYDDEYDDEDDEYDDDDDEDEDDEDNRRPRLEPTQLEQLPKVEKKAFCQKWILGQKNVDYLLKEEPLRSPSARLAKTPPPPTPSSSSTSKAAARPTSTGLPVAPKVSPNKRKLEDAMSNLKSAKTAAANHIAGTTSKSTMQQPAGGPPVGTAQAGGGGNKDLSQVKIVAAPPFKIATQPVKIAPTPVKIVRIQNMSAASSGNGVITPAQLEALKSQQQSQPKYRIITSSGEVKTITPAQPQYRIIRTTPTGTTTSTAMISPTQLQALRAMQQKQQQLQPKFRLVSTTPGTMTTTTPSIVPTSTQSPIKVVRVGANATTQSNGSGTGGTYPRLVRTIGPKGFPIKTLLVKNDLPTGSKIIFTNNTCVPTLVNSAGQQVKLVELQQQQSSSAPKPASALDTSDDRAATDSSVPSKKRKMETEPEIKADPDPDPLAEKRGCENVTTAVAKSVSPSPSSSPLKRKAGRNIGGRFTVKLEPGEGPVLRRSPRLVNARKVYS